MESEVPRPTDDRLDNERVYGQIYHTIVSEWALAWKEGNATFSYFTHHAYMLARTSFNKRMPIDLLTPEFNLHPLGRDLAPEDTAVVDGAKWICRDLDARLSKKAGS